MSLSLSLSDVDSSCWDMMLPHKMLSSRLLVVGEVRREGHGVMEVDRELLWTWRVVGSFSPKSWRGLEQIMNVFVDGWMCVKG